MTDYDIQVTFFLTSQPSPPLTYTISLPLFPSIQLINLMHGLMDCVSSVSAGTQTEVLEFEAKKAYHYTT